MNYYTSYKPSVNNPSMTIGLHIFEHERNSIKNVIQLRIMNYEAWVLLNTDCKDLTNKFFIPRDSCYL